MTRSFNRSLLAVFLITLSTSVMAAALAIRVVSVTSPAKPGTDARLQIETSPGAECGITVVYKSGPSRARGLVAKRANDRGQIVWVWRVGTRTTPGTWPVVVECTLGQQRAQVKTQFMVQ